MRVLSFDIGLRNLAATVVAVATGWTPPPECLYRLSSDETVDAYKARAMRCFLDTGWQLEQCRVINIRDAAPGVDTAAALTDALTELEEAWFPGVDTAPDRIVVEVQHNCNPTMRAICMGVLVFFRRSMPDTVLEAIAGSHKLKVCDALGFPLGSGIATIRRRGQQGRGRTGTATATADDGEGDEASLSDVETKERAQTSWRRVPGGGAGGRAGAWIRTADQTAKYTDNKRRACLALHKLAEGTHASARAVQAALKLQRKHDDIADSLLQGLWIAWRTVSPRVPRAVMATDGDEREREPKPQPQRRNKKGPTTGGANPGTVLCTPPLVDVVDLTSADIDDAWDSLACRHV